MDQLLGITWPNWKRLLSENHYAIQPRRLPRVLFLTIRSLYNSAKLKKEEQLFPASVWSGVEVKAPVFIIGHWRSGTTLLHYLMAQDPQFTYPTILQISNPQTFLSFEDRAYERVKNMPPLKRPMDNMEFRLSSPGEDEFATCAMSIRSPLVSWAFPRREQFYDRYLTFQGVSAEDRNVWKESLVTFFQKITWKYQRPILVKSPPHTARLDLLREIFPDARFIHLRRDPYKLFQSTLHLYHQAVNHTYLQIGPSEEQLHEGILKRFNTIYTDYFAAAQRVPAGQLCEVSFEDFTRDKLCTLEQIYTQLDLPGFAAARPAFESYINGLQGYTKNTHRELPDSLRRKIRASCAQAFELWGY